MHKKCMHKKNRPFCALFDILTQNAAGIHFSCKMLASFKKTSYLCNMNKKRREKFADLLLDIAKYIITAVLLATWFSDVAKWEWYSYLIPVVVVVSITVGGLLLYKEEDNQKQKTK